MKNLHMYMCDLCGHSQDTAAKCPNCELALTQYTKETQREYMVDMEEAMRVMSPLRWYL
jgi:hypothetical protein